MQSLEWVFGDTIFLYVTIAAVSVAIVLMLSLYLFCCYYAMKGKLDLVYDEETGEPMNSLKISQLTCCSCAKGQQVPSSANKGLN